MKDNKPYHLINWRKKAGLTHLDVAVAIGIARSYYTSIENNHRELTVKIVKGLMNAYGLSADFILTGKESLIVKSEVKTYFNYCPNCGHDLKSILTK